MSTVLALVWEPRALGSGGSRQELGCGGRGICARLPSLALGVETSAAQGTSSMGSGLFSNVCAISAFLCPGIAPGAHRCPSSSHTLTFGSRAVSQLGEEQVGPLLQLPEALGLG